MATGQIDAVLFSPASVPPAGMAEEPSDGQLLSRFVADRDELAERAFAAPSRGTVRWCFVSASRSSATGTRPRTPSRPRS